MPSTYPVPAPNDWIRIFAARLAQRHPGYSAEEVVRRAIGAFAASGHLAPEVVVAPV